MVLAALPRGKAIESRLNCLFGAEHQQFAL
jgi:hypothetical protein